MKGLSVRSLKFERVRIRKRTIPELIFTVLSLIQGSYVSEATFQNSLLWILSSCPLK